MEILKEILETNFIDRTLQRCHCPSNMIEDIRQDLLLSWLQNPDALNRASEGGYLSSYIISACKNQVSMLNRGSKKFIVYESETDRDYINGGCTIPVE